MAVSGTATITIPQSGTVTPFRTEDWSTYGSDSVTATAAWKANPHGWMTGSPPSWFNQQRITVDVTQTYQGHPTLRYDWPGPAVPGWGGCSTDVAIVADYLAPDVREYWLEVAHRFASNFSTNQNGIEGGTCGVAEYKFLLQWRKGTGGRFDLKNGHNGRQWWAVYPGGTNQTAYGANCSGVGFNCRLGYGDQQSGFLSSIPGDLHDGLWHVYRTHIRLPATKGDTDGAHRIWIDGVKVFEATGLDFISADGSWSNRIGEIFLGANSNSGTPVATQTWWGHMKLYTSDPGWI